MCKVRQNFETSTGLLLDIIPGFFTRGVRDDSDSGLVATFPRCAPLYAIPFTLLRTNVCRWFDERFVAHEALMYSFTRRVPHILLSPFRATSHARDDCYVVSILC